MIYQWLLISFCICFGGTVNNFYLHFSFKRRIISSYVEGIFPRDNPRNTRFSINFFTAIGLGGVTSVFIIILFTLFIIESISFFPYSKSLFLSSITLKLLSFYFFVLTFRPVVSGFVYREISQRYTWLENYYCPLTTCFIFFQLINNFCIQHFNFG